jgi:hypothetical protein
VFIGKHNDVNGSSWWVGCGLIDPMDPASDNVAVFFLEDDAHNDQELKGATVVNDNLWHHVVAVRDDIVDENRLSCTSTARWTLSSHKTIPGRSPTSMCLRSLSAISLPDTGTLAFWTKWDCTTGRLR